MGNRLCRLLFLWWVSSSPSGLDAFNDAALRLLARLLQAEAMCGNAWRGMVAQMVGYYLGYHPVVRTELRDWLGVTCQHTGMDQMDRSRRMPEQQREDLVVFIGREKLQFSRSHVRISQR